MIEKLNKTTICSIVFLDIIDYSKKSVSEQIDIKNQFNQLINHSLKDLDEKERIILDTGDGAAIAHMGSPEDALFVSLSIRDEVLKSNILSSMPLYVRFGINLGPVRLVSDINGQPNIIGDGINVAQRIMSFAKPNQVVVSRSYYDVTSRLTQEISQMFDYSGMKSDKHMREHEIYAVRLMKEVAPIEVTPIKTAGLKSKSLKPTNYLEPVQQFFKRINWKYVALSLPAIFTSVLVIKSAAAPSQPMITLQNATPTAHSQTVEAPKNSTLLLPNETLEAKPAKNNIELAHYAVDSNTVDTNTVDKSKAEKAADVKVATLQPTEAQLDQTILENKKADKKIAKKSTSKKSAKKPANQLPSEFIAPESSQAQEPKTVAQAVEPQIAVESPTTQKSGWKTFTDSVKQGQDRACTQAEVMMNQCH